MMLLPYDMVLKQDGEEFWLFQYNGERLNDLPIDGPWTDETTAIREAVPRWVLKGDLYLQTGPDTYRVLNN
jgi:hypothetical protein